VCGGACRYVEVRVGVWRRADACRCVWLQVHAHSVELLTPSLRASDSRIKGIRDAGRDVVSGM